MSTSQPRLTRIERAIRAADSSTNRAYKAIELRKFMHGLKRSDHRRRMAFAKGRGKGSRS